MPTPPFTFRLAKLERERVVEMARIFGAPNASAFVREMVSAICSGNMVSVNGFLTKLGEKLTGQMALELEQQAVAEMKKAAALVKLDRPTISMTGSFRSRLSQAKRLVKWEEARKKKRGKPRDGTS